MKQLIGLIVFLFVMLIFADTLICPQCQKENKKSNVYVGWSSTTLMDCGNGYYDTLGVYHAPENCNTTTTQYKCSNGHTFTKQR